MPQYARNNQVTLIDLGCRPYKEVWDFQEQLLQRIVDLKIQNRSAETPQKTKNYLLFVEHSPVFTLGKSGDKKNLLVPEDVLQEKNIEYFHINRGGDITFHGPGQMVGYPIFDLENFYTDVHRYLRDIEEVIIQVLSKFGLQGYRVDGRTGVWVNDRKICAIGVRTSRWVTMHGFALNVNTDLKYFQYIIPCGIADKEVTSMANELGQTIPMDAVKGELKNAFETTFNVELLKGNEI